MAWWKTGEADDIAGDWPADILDRACAELLAQAKPDGPWHLADFLGVWQDALNFEPHTVLTDAYPDSRYRLVAHVAPLDSDIVNRLEATPQRNRESAAQCALKALQDVARAYLDAAERKPRQRELARALRFSFANPLEDGRFTQGALDLLKLDIQPFGSNAP